ncbi:MAG: DNA polymerase III subunit delta [Solirubrobacterales bacterium]
MATLKRAYLFTGDDEVKIDQTRKRLVARAEQDGASIESLSGDACTPQNFAGALTSPSLLPGTRIVLADGVERWRAADVGPAADAIATLADDSLDAVAVLICRKKPLKAIAEAIASIDGEQREFKPPSDAQLPKWIVQQSEQLGVTIEQQTAALLVELVGKPQKRVSSTQNWSPKRRLLSELEKLATSAGPGGTITPEQVGDEVRGVATTEVFDLTDAALEGNAELAVRKAEQLLAGGESPPGIVAMLARSFGQAQSVAALVESGRGGEVSDQLGIQPWLAGKLTKQAQLRGGSELRDALVELARLDDAVKGGTSLDAETELLRSVVAITR